MTKPHSRQSAIVVQFGGRHQYAVPHALANRGRLAAFYTDLCAGAGAGRLVPALSRIAGGRMMIDLTNRRPPDNVLSCTTTYLRWMTDLRAAQRHADPVARVFATAAVHDRVARQMVRRGFGAASHVLTQFGEAIPLHHAARNAGLTVATDVNIAPSTEEIVRREQAAHPDWESPALYYGQTLPESGHWRRPMARLAEATDLFLCPSDFVRRDLIENFGIVPERTRLVPYPVNPKWFAVENRPVPGRVLFAGGVGLRKGIHVLAAAARILRDRRAGCEVVVAGGGADGLRARPDCAALHFLGRMTGPQMMAEFARADVFALPSLAEGSAGVTYEALGAAVPVVTTFESGSVVEDGVHGFIVPARDAEALADAIQRLTADRDLRARMAVAARQKAMDYIWSRYEQRLDAALFAPPGGMA